MNKPVNAKEQKRNCHVKLMIVDDLVAIQGNTRVCHKDGSEFMLK